MKEAAKVFLGTSDSSVIQRLEEWAQAIGPVETFVGVMGGFICFSLIEKIRPKKIILFDRSPLQVVIFKLVKALVEISSELASFVSRLLSRSNFLNTEPAEKTWLEDTLEKLASHPDFEPAWKQTLSALANAQALDKGVYQTPDTNDGRPLFVENPVRYNLNGEKLKGHLDHLSLSLYYGEGWLKDRQSFEYIKERLTDGSAAALELKIQRLKPLKTHWSPDSNLLWVSNIGFFERWGEQPAEHRLDFLRRVPKNTKILTSARLLTPAELLDLP